MILITRFPGERIRIGNDITIRVTSHNGRGVSISIEAPAGIPIVREDPVAQEITDADYALPAGDISPSLSDTCD